MIATDDHKKVFDQIVLWGQASWWPSNCIMKFEKIGDKPVQKGTLYHQRVKAVFGPRWRSLVTDIIENSSISRRYCEGFIEGEETVRLLPFGAKTKVEYALDYTIRGRLHAVAWKACLEALHNRNIKLVLQHLKSYLEQ